MTSETKPRPVFGLVLAGGQSRRMGHDKAALQRDGQSQLSYVVHLLEDAVERVFVSTRADQQDEPERRRFEQIVDRYEGIGPIAGILSAMDEHPAVAWLVLACDLPNIDRETLRYLLSRRSGDKPFTAYRSSHDGLPEPLCAIYAPSGSAVIRRFVAQGVHCPRKILIRSDTLLLPQPHPEALDNVNTPEDLAGSILEAAS